MTASPHSTASLRFRHGTGLGILRPNGLQPLHPITFISNITVVTQRRKAAELAEKQKLEAREMEELKARGFQARRGRVARERQEKKANWARELEKECEEKKLARENADMWTTPRMAPLASPPNLIKGVFLDTFLPSDSRFRKLFPDDPAKRARMKDLMGEYGALHDYTNWAGAMIEEPENKGGRKGFFEKLAGCLSEDTVMVLIEVQGLFMQASEMGKFEYCFLTNTGKTDDLRRRLLEGGEKLRHESGLYSCTLESSEKEGMKEIWEKYGDLVPTELERFNHLWLGEAGDTSELQKQLIPASKPDAIFTNWSPSIRTHYAHLIPSLMEQFEYEYAVAPDLIVSQLEVATDAQINSMPPEWHEKYGFLVSPSLFRFHKRNCEKEIEYIRIWEYDKMVEEWDLEVVDAYPLFSDLERFERIQHVHRPDATSEGYGILSGIQVLKKKMLQVSNAKEFLAEYGDEVVKKYQHLIPTDAERFEHWHVKSRSNGTKTLGYLPREGSLWDQWSPAIKQAYAHLHPTDMELFEQERVGEEGDLSKMELYLMRNGESAFEGWGEEVRQKWRWLCPTPEERFNYLFFDKDERGQFKPNAEFLVQVKLAFEGWSEDIKQRYGSYVSSTW